MKDVTEKLIEELLARRAVGIQKYGKPLLPHDGTDALVEARDEALDLAQYLQQLIMERSTT